MNNATDKDTLLGLGTSRVWDTDSAFQHLRSLGKADTKRTAERRLNALNFLPPELTPASLQDELDRPTNQVTLNWALDKARSQRKLVLFLQLSPLPTGEACLYGNDARGGRYWLPLRNTNTQTPDSAAIIAGLQQIQHYIGKDIAIFPHRILVGLLRPMGTMEHITFTPSAYLPTLELPAAVAHRTDAAPHLKRLEAESIFIIREAVAEAENPVMLYSIGKDSSVMLHLARKAFYPAPPPFPLLHVDTRWKFQEMYLFRNAVARASGMPLLVHVNPEAVARDINPFDHGSALHTDITKTQGLKQALDANGFDVVFGGARRDEEKSRAKERIFSFRDAHHAWDPKNQRPELWSLYNTRKRKGESIRVFPLSNWTELDVWQYIHEEAIAVVPLYFAKTRPVVQRDGLLLMIDDDRFRMLPGERIESREVRFRTLGCYPLSGAVESRADSVPAIIDELLSTRQSERQGRAIDSDGAASMERKKKEGYF